MHSDMQNVINGFTYILKTRTIFAFPILNFVELTVLGFLWGFFCLLTYNS